MFATRVISQFLRRFPSALRLPYLVFRGFQSRYTIGVAAVVLDPSRRVLLVEHAYHPRHPWGLPGGWVDRDEAPHLAITRELKEELQLRAEPARLLDISRTSRNHLDIAYLCAAKSPIGKLSHELLAYRWVAPEDLPVIKAFHRRSIQLALEQPPGSAPWESD